MGCPLRPFAVQVRGARARQKELHWKNGRRVYLAKTEREKHRRSQVQDKSPPLSRGAAPARRTTRGDGTAIRLEPGFCKTYPKKQTANEKAQRGQVLVSIGKKTVKGSLGIVDRTPQKRPSRGYYKVVVEQEMGRGIYQQPSNAARFQIRLSEIENAGQGQVRSRR